MSGYIGSSLILSCGYLCFLGGANKGKELKKLVVTAEEESSGDRELSTAIRQGWSADH
jgi:hypothetical protein